jgi:hypothetical protein
MNRMQWGGSVRAGSICGGYTLIELDGGRPFPRLNPDARKCKSCLSTLEGREMTNYLDADEPDFAIGVNAPRMDPVSVLERRIERHQTDIERLERRKEWMESLPEEPIGEDGTTMIWFQKPLGSRVYTYGAVRTPDGLWNTTGPKSPKAYRWHELITWIVDRGNEDVQIWFANQFEQL